MHPGARIRRLRCQQGRTLQEVADACGFTRSLLSKIETGKTSPPVSTLIKIATALGTRLSALLDDAAASGTIFTPAKATQEAPLERTDKGYVFFPFAAARGDKAMQPILFVAERGKVKPKPLSHAGEEFVYVLEGRLKYRVGNVEYQLGPGDSLYFDAIEEHDLEPLSERAVLLGVFQTASPSPDTQAREERNA